MKKLFFIYFVLILFFCVSSAAANILPEGFEHKVNQADIIVEGLIQVRTQLPQKRTEGYVGTNATSVYWQFDVREIANVYITKHYKGQIRPGESIAVYLLPQAFSGIEDFKSNQKYLLFLSKRNLKPGYQILDQGKACWQIFNYEGELRLRAWNQDARLRPKESYAKYDAFVDLLKDQIYLQYVEDFSGDLSP